MDKPDDGDTWAQDLSTDVLKQWLKADEGMFGAEVFYAQRELAKRKVEEAIVYGYTDEVMNGYCDCPNRQDLHGRKRNCWRCIEKEFTKAREEARQSGKVSQG